MRLLTWPLLVSLLLFASHAAAQQPKPAQKGAGVVELEGRVGKVEAELDELRKGVAEGSQAAQSVAELTAQVTALRQQVEGLQKAAAGDEAVRRELDALNTRLGELRQEVAALRAAVHAGAAPETHSLEGGVGASGVYRDGFVLVDGDRFALRMKGYMQLRYVVKANELIDELEESSFIIRRARLSWDGRIHSPLIKYKVQLDFGRGKAELLDYYVDVKAGPVILRGGQYKTQFSRDFLTSAEALSFVDRSVATDEFRYDRDIGVSAIWTGLGGKLEATASVFNGAGKNVPKNDNLDPLLVVRVAGTVLGEPWRLEEGDFDGVHPPALALGVSGTFENAPVPNDYFYENQAVEQYRGNPAADPERAFDTDVDGNGERDNVRVMQIGLDMALRWRGLGIEAEAYARREDWGEIGAGQNLPFTPDDTYLGAFAQASYFILPERVQIGARGSWTEVSPLVLGGKSSTTPVSDTRRELSAILAYYRYRHGVELTAMYSFLDWGTEDGDPPSGAGEQRLIVEMQAAF